ncbi:hypothetical protein IH781_03765 [Patescibacteria group bacterium]|nr:hypothetical protein [Patescibacteria group bacterium]
MFLVHSLFSITLPPTRQLALEQSTGGVVWGALVEAGLGVEVDVLVAVAAYVTVGGLSGSTPRQGGTPW